jgi:hypothetical protein
MTEDYKEECPRCGSALRANATVTHYAMDWTAYGFDLTTTEDESVHGLYVFCTNDRCSFSTTDPDADLTA